MRIRQSSRVVLINDRDEVFMFRHTGKHETYWILPGGGVEEGETWEDAAIREMWEETGIRDVPLGPLLWTRRSANHLGSTPHIGHERYYLVRCGMQNVTNAYQLEEEKRIYTHQRWWTVDEIRATDEVLYPVRLAELLPPVIEGRVSPSPIAIRD